MGLSEGLPRITKKGRKGFIMERSKKEGEGFSFSSNPAFKDNLLRRLKKSVEEELLEGEGELSESDMMELSAAQGEAQSFCCPNWKNDNAEGYLSCMNCTNLSCIERSKSLLL